MSYKFWLPKAGTLLIIAGLVFSSFTNAFAQNGEKDALGEPLETTMNQLFLPLVQIGSAANVNQADAPFIDTAMVDSVELLTLRSFPMQINAVVRGNLPNSCTRIGEIQQQHAADKIRVKITTIMLSADLVCAAVLTPFEQTISLNVLGLTAGKYTVVLHGLQANFTLAAENVAPDTVYMPLVSR